MAWPVTASSVTPTGRPDPPPVSRGPWLGADNGVYVGYALFKISDRSV